MSEESFNQLPVPTGYTWSARTGTKEKRDSWREENTHETHTPKRKATADPYASDDGGGQSKKRKTTASKSLGSGRRMSNRVTDAYDDDVRTPKSRRASTGVTAAKATKSNDCARRPSVITSSSESEEETRNSGSTNKKGNANRTGRTGSKDAGRDDINDAKLKTLHEALDDDEVGIDDPVSIDRDCTNPFSQDGPFFQDANGVDFTRRDVWYLMHWQDPAAEVMKKVFTSLQRARDVDGGEGSRWLEGGKDGEFTYCCNRRSIFLCSGTA